MNSFGEIPELYDVARRVCHEHGMDWTDPRTGVTYPAPPACHLQVNDWVEFGTGAVCQVVCIASDSCGDVKVSVRLGEESITVPLKDCRKVELEEQDE